MQRIEALNESQAGPDTAELLAAVKSQLGSVPNIIATLARSTAALRGYLGLSEGLAGGRLGPRLREQIALTVAGRNGCDYCASAHSALGARAGLDATEIKRNLEGASSDPQSAAALNLAGAIVDTRGHVANDDLLKAREAGFSDEEIVEILANTVLNVFTNYFNHVARTEIDFPLVRAQAAAA